jgi:hypothetical protein
VRAHEVAPGHPALLDAGRERRIAAQTFEVRSFVDLAAETCDWNF